MSILGVNKKYSAVGVRDYILQKSRSNLGGWLSATFGRVPARVARAPVLYFICPGVCRSPGSASHVCGSVSHDPISRVRLLVITKPFNLFLFFFIFLLTLRFQGYSLSIGGKMIHESRVYENPQEYEAEVREVILDNWDSARYHANRRGYTEDLFMEMFRGFTPTWIMMADPAFFYGRI